ncbi:TPA: hypothetical protein ENS27_17410 [bacterium]|nr:hypothetical protein [bacterium]
MTNKNIEQEAQLSNKEELFSNDITEDMLEEDKEMLVPISELRKVRSEAAKYRKELQSIKTKIDEEKRTLEASNKEEIEKLRSIASKTETELHSLRGKISRSAKESAIVNAASILGYCNPKDAISLIEFSQIDIDEDGNVDEDKVFELVKELGESKPYLRKGQIRTYYGPTNPAPKQGNLPKPKTNNSNQIEQLKYQARDLTRQGKILEATRIFNRAWEAENGIKK